jgi:uncharacterized membrane protein
VTEPIAARDAVLRDQALDQILGRVLQAGVLIAAAVVVVGAVPLLWHHGHELVSVPPVSDEPAMLRSVPAIVRGAIQGHVAAVIQLGLLLLIATPVTRVALTLVAFLIRRDRIFVAVTAVVLAVLLYGVLG